MFRFLEKICIKLNIEYKIVKFLFVGALNTFFGYSIFALCIFLKQHYAVATLIATVLGVLFNFKTTGILVFQNNDNRLLFRFICVYVISYFISIAILKTLLFLGFANMYINSALWLLPNALLSYLLFKIWVFKK